MYLRSDYYIQSAWRVPDEEKMQQEQRSLSLIDDNFRKIIVVGERLKLQRNERGIVTVGIYDFLLDRQTLDR